MHRSVEAPTGRLYWCSWALAVALTGVVAGFMIGHALLLGRYIDWLLQSDRQAVVSQTYSVFAHSAGRLGLAVYYAVCAAQVLAALAFAIISLVARHRPLAGAIAGLAGGIWPAVHYASGFAALEAAVLRSTTVVTASVARSFVAWNGPVHIFHGAMLMISLAALLSAGLSGRLTSRA